VHRKPTVVNYFITPFRYMEPVEVSGKGIEATVREVMHGKKED
jgi:hypothetical protein